MLSRLLCVRGLSPRLERVAAAEEDRLVTTFFVGTAFFVQSVSEIEVDGRKTCIELETTPLCHS